MVALGGLGPLQICASCASSSLHGASQRLSAGLENKGRKGEGAGKEGNSFLEAQKGPCCLHPEMESMFLSMAKGEKM